MAHSSRTRIFVAFSLGSLLAVAGQARAHVLLLAPNGGEVLEVGSVVTIEWMVLIAHPLENWDLWYSESGSSGPWIPIVMDLPPGSGAGGTEYEYEWTVPVTMTSEGRVRVRMDTTRNDYEDISDDNFSIVDGGCYADCDMSSGAGVLDLLDFLCFQDSFMRSETYACDCDTSTGVSVCDIFDFLCFQNAFVGGCP